VIVFLTTGLTLRSGEVMHGLTAWRVHTFIQGFSYVLFPLATWVLVWLLGHQLPDGLRVGFYILAAVPTTITSCVVFTHLAGGSMAVALFNAVVGNLSGVLLTPIIMLIMMGVAKISVDVDELAVLQRLGLIVVLPFVVGQIIHHAARGRTAGVRKPMAITNRICILFIVLIAFGAVFGPEVQRVSLIDVAVPLACVIPGHFVVLWLAWAGAKLCGFARRDCIAVVFTAPQKTLALGIPLATTILQERADLIGLAILPLIVYHTLQLFVSGFLVNRLKRT